MVVLCIGRFIFGLAAGVLVSVGPGIISETVPSHVLDRGYGVSTNVIFNVMILVSMLFGNGMPKTEEELAVTSYWRYVYGFPFVLLVPSLFCMFFLHKYDSVMTHIRKGQKDKALVLLKRVYPNHDDFTYGVIYHNIAKSLGVGDDSKTGSEAPQAPTEAGFAETVCGKEYRASTWVCIFLAIANQLAGVNTLNIYAGNIFSSIITKSE